MAYPTKPVDWSLVSRYRAESRQCSVAGCGREATVMTERETPSGRVVRYVYCPRHADTQPRTDWS